MSDAVWSTWHKNKANTVDQLKKIKLNTNDVGQYQHNDVIKFIKQLKQVAKEQFNPLDKKNGMIKLFDKNQNFINLITTKDAYNFKDILRKLKDEVFKASTATKTVEPNITSDRRPKMRPTTSTKSTRPSWASKRASKRSM